MISIRIAAGAALAFMSAGAAQAQSLTGSSPGFHYFYKAGADLERHDADLVACAVATRALVNGSDASGSMAAAAATGGLAGGLIAGLIGGVIDNNENRQGAAANTENCMALRGWSVVALARDEGRAMEEPDDPASIRAKLAPFVEAAAPQGPVLRGPFGNELAVGTFKVDEARDLEEVSMSVRATRDQTRAAVEAAGELMAPRPPKDVKAPKPAKAMKAGELADADPEKPTPSSGRSGIRSTST